MGWLNTYFPQAHSVHKTHVLSKSGYILYTTMAPSAIFALFVLTFVDRLFAANQ